MINKPGLAARIARRVDRLLTELQESLCVGKRAFFLSSARSRHEKNLGGNIFRLELSALDLWRIEPE